MDQNISLVATAGEVFQTDVHVGPPINNTPLP